MNECTPCVDCYHIYIRACRDLDLTSTLPTMSNMFGFGTSAPSSPPQMTPRTTTPNTFSLGARRSSSPFGGYAFGSRGSISSSTPNSLASPRSPSTAGVPGNFGPGSTGSLTRPSTPFNHRVQDHSKTIVSDVRVAKKGCLE